MYRSVSITRFTLSCEYIFELTSYYYLYSSFHGNNEHHEIGNCISLRLKNLWRSKEEKDCKMKLYWKGKWKEEILHHERERGLCVQEKREWERSFDPRE